MSEETLIEEEKAGKKESWEWIKAILIAFAIAFIIRQFLFAPVIVDGESMVPTLEHGDRMIVNKMAYTFSDPNRFDIIVFHAPAGKDYIKRIIGLPGDEIKFENDILYVNGEEVAEVYLDELRTSYSSENLTHDFEAIIVPEDQVFVLGDNRRRSKDSRDIGTIHMDEVIGRANIVFWPLSNIRMAE
ncbi:signal peptidase I [Halalkalibacter hemicellulosilyticus]|uniref:Signal peptidase I n=1 Tax=Halalkalibacter hemicellulosilyticusJCM 9152 TaxID=1236971 RepID=W4QCW9_9BACI|nr:signal peptidase I [Halalkalibacter hemicellulosilyticus]GAE29224.1 signal peptidase I [Halalkalibacter hemicellulosilyticusJCM 9152]